MATAHSQSSTGAVIKTFAPIFQKNLERLQRCGMNNSSEAQDLRRALEKIASDKT